MDSVVEIQNLGLIILAAGASSRMGEPKQLLKIESETLVRRAAKTALASQILSENIVLVSGSNAELIENEVKDLKIKMVENLEWETGMASSIKAGFDVMFSQITDIQGIIIMLADQPLVNADLLNQLITQFQTSNFLIIASEYKDIVGVPALFDASVFEELYRLKGDMGARKVIFHHLNETYKIPFPEGAWDVDTPEDYQKILDFLNDNK